MRTISIYYRPFINVESDGIVRTREIYDADGDRPYYFLDGARHELKEEDVEKLRRRTTWRM